MRWGVLIVVMVFVAIISTSKALGEYVYNDCLILPTRSLDVKLGLEKTSSKPGAILNPPSAKDWNINQSNANTYFFEDF